MRYELGTLYQKLMLYKKINVGKPKECVLFGQDYEIYDNIDDPKNKFLRAYQDIIWFTYRKNFPILLDNKLSPADYYVNDTGWGCMIRVCQMMMAETLKRCMKDSNFIVTNLNEKIISLYLDCHTTPEESPFSIQNICKLLYDEFKLKPGQWFKASNVFLVIQQIHSKYKNIIFERLHAIPNHTDLDLEIFLEGTIYLDKISAYSIDCIALPQKKQRKAGDHHPPKIAYGFEEVEDYQLKEE